MTIFIIAACSIVHSIFGVGLLVFGTPIFMLLGHSYAETLWIVLPPSIAINGFQIWEQRSLIEKPKKLLLLITIPTALFGLCALIYFNEINIRKAVGLMLVFSAVLRFSPSIQEKLKTIFARREGLVIFFIGAIHGLSNMGGGLLTTMMGFLYPTKEAFRVNVAFGYVVMAIIKVLTLLSLGIYPARAGDVVLNIFVATTTYLFLGNILFQKVGKYSFQHAVTVLILSFGLLLLV